MYPRLVNALRFNFESFLSFIEFKITALSLNCFMFVVMLPCIAFTDRDKLQFYSLISSKAARKKVYCFSILLRKDYFYEYQLPNLSDQNREAFMLICSCLFNALCFNFESFILSFELQATALLFLCFAFVIILPCNGLIDRKKLQFCFSYLI